MPSISGLALAGALHARMHHSSSPPSFTNNLTGYDSLLSASDTRAWSRAPAVNIYLKQIAVSAQSPGVFKRELGIKNLWRWVIKDGLAYLCGSENVCIKIGGKGSNKIAIMRLNRSHPILGQLICRLLG